MAKIVNTLRWRKGKEDESPKAPNAHKVPDVRARDVCCLSMFPVMAAIRITWIIAKRDVTGGLGMDIY